MTFVTGETRMEGFYTVKEAKGVDKVVIKKTNAVHVKNKTLEIRFHWSVNGTTASPRRGIYGTLISTISIESGNLLNLHTNLNF